MTEDISPTFKGNRSAYSKARILLIIVAIIAVTAVIILIVGIVLIALAGKKDCQGKGSGDSGSTEKQMSSSFCDYSEEANRVDIDGIILRVKKTY